MSQENYVEYEDDKGCRWKYDEENKEIFLLSVPDEIDEVTVPSSLSGGM